MSNKRDELNREIDKWALKVQSNPDFLELAFFKIFVKFENFITEAIFDYATKKVENTNKVLLRISFDDREHFKNVTGIQYLDTSPKTKKLVDQIFTNTNIISVFFDSQDSTFFEQMKFLRNYIAHESEESKNKYLRKTLNSDVFVEPNQFLMTRNRNEVDSVYARFINLVKTYSESIDFDS